MSDRGSASAGPMRLVLRGNLPFVTISARHAGVSTQVVDVLVDTGSASTVLSADLMAQLGVVPQPADRLRALRGIGGRELVFTRRFQSIEVDGHSLADFEVARACRSRDRRRGQGERDAPSC